MEGPGCAAQLKIVLDTFEELGLLVALNKLEVLTFIIIIIIII